MRKLRNFLFALLLSGCADAPWLNPVDDPPNGDEAIAVAIQSLEQHTNTELDFNVEIHWVGQRCIDYTDDGICILGWKWNGPFYPDCEIWVALRNRNGYHTTALAHELLHCALQEEKGDSDSDHTDPWWKDSLIIDLVNQDLVEWEKTLSE